MKTLEEMGKFQTVVVDPPWDLPWATAGVRGHGYDSTPYSTLTIDQLADLPIPAVLEKDSLLFCWTTNRMLPCTFPLLSEWSVNYWFTIVWNKAGGPQGKGMPAYNGEYCVVAKRGDPAFLDTKAFHTVNFWPRSEHSAKPEGFYDLLRRVTPGPRLDVFGRRRIAGFTSWGNEAPEGEPRPDHYQQVLLEG